MVIGNMQILYADPYWRSLIRFAVRRGAYEGPEMQTLGMHDDAGVLVSKLEENFINRNSLTSNGDIVAGSVARMALGDE